MKRKFYFRLGLATLLALFFVGVGQVKADDGTATVKMTYVDGGNENVKFGEVTTVPIGYLKISGGALTLGFKRWNCNNIAYLQVDASSIPGTITSATLKATVTGSTDSKRAATYGVGYNSSSWESDTTYAKADKSITTLGKTYTTTTKSSAEKDAESASFDIGDAFKNDADKIVTILVYCTNAAGGNFSNPTVTITYTNATVYSANLAEANGLKPTIKIYSDEAKTKEVDENSLENGTYYYTATLAGYDDYSGSFVVNGADANVSFTMKEQTRYAFTVNAVDADNNIIKALYTDADAYDGKAEATTAPAYLTDENGKVTYSKNDKTYNYSYTASSTTATQTVAYTAYVGDAYFVEGEDKIKATPATSGNYSNGNAVRNFTTSKELFTVPTDGTYKLTYATCSNSVGTNKDGSIKTTALYFYKNSDDNQIAEEGDITWSLNKIQTDGTKSAENIILFKGDKILTKGSTTNTILDYILLERTGDPSSTITINTTSSLASFSNAAAVTVPEGVTIYKASAPSDNTVTLTKVDDNVIPANTGVILYKENGGDVTLTYGGTAKNGSYDGNALKAATSDYTVPESETVYALVAGEQAIAKVSAGVAIPAGKAYLPVAASTTGAKLNLVFGGSTTGINNVNVDKDADKDAPAFNLAGQRVGNGFRGIVIKGGKKYIQK